MSDAVFPTLPGLMWGVTKAPQFSTVVQTSVGGYEVRAARYGQPRWRYQLAYEFLRTDATEELARLLDFFVARRGKFDTFWFRDPDDCIADRAFFGIGDGATAQFQLGRQVGPSANLLPNGNGEAGATAPGLVYNPGQARSGNWCWELDYGTGAAALTISTLPCAFGDVFAFEGAIKAASGHPYLGLLFLDANGGNLGALGGTPPAGPSYQHVRFAATAPAGAATVVFYLEVDDGAAGGVAYADDLRATRLAAGAVEPVTAFLGVPTIYVDDAPVACSVSGTGLVTFPSTPAAGTVLRWSGQYYRRVRFDLDAAEFSTFAQGLYELKTLTLVTVR